MYNELTLSAPEYRIEDKLLASAITLLNNLRQRHSRLVAVRVDLSFKEIYQSNVSFIDISHCLKRLWNNHRHNSLFAYCLGWIWRIEYAEDCQYHAHCIFIFHGHHIRNDVYYGDQIGDYWANRITGGQGCYHNCNRNKEKYSHYGIGTIDRNKDADRFNNLLNFVLPYLAKESPLTRQMMQRDAEALGISTSGMRTFGCSC